MPLRFRKQSIADERYESAAVFDVNNDGALDIVSGAYWYEGPDFTTRHYIGEVPASGDYYDEFGIIPLDVNGDGHLDHVTGGWFGGTLQWRENPGSAEREWPLHRIAGTGNIEAVCGWDIDGDGDPEIVPNVPGGPLVAYKLVRNAEGKGTGEFSEHPIHDRPQGHGLGFGDIAGNGRADIVLTHGWLEAPVDPYAGEWVYHGGLELGSASVPIIVADVNGDGLGDLIVGQAHGYGLDWWEQRRTEAGEVTWSKHPIDPFNSQYHALLWEDLDGDGECELITGKRYWAHCGNDPGANDDLGVVYFKWTGESFAKQFVDYGPLGTGAGCGIAFAVADLRGTGRLDIVAPGKDGLQVFFNEGG